MEKAFAKADELADTIKDYVHTRAESIKLNVAEKGSSAISYMVAGIVIAGVFLLFIIFVSAALALGLGEWTGKPWLGFLLVSCLHLLTGILVWVARVKIIQIPVMNAFIKHLFNNPHEED